MQEPRLFRYEWIWEKPCATGFLNARRMPLKAHESILVFYKRLPTYNPQMTPGEPYVKRRDFDKSPITTYAVSERSALTDNPTGARFPRDVLRFNHEHGLHPTQKPVPLLEYLIKTYTDPGQTVLDNCMGSGSTGVACARTGRQFIGIEQEKKYFDIAKERIRKGASDARLKEHT